MSAKSPLTLHVEASLRRRGEATVSQILADVSRHISSARAVREGRGLYLKDCKRRGFCAKTKPKRRLESAGRRQLVAYSLRTIVIGGLAERIGVGRYRWIEAEKNGKA